MYVNGPHICVAQTTANLPAGTYGSQGKYKTGKLEPEIG